MKRYGWREKDGRGKAANKERRGGGTERERWRGRNQSESSAVGRRQTNTLQ